MIIKHPSCLRVAAGTALTCLVAAGPASAQPRPDASKPAVSTLRIDLTRVDLAHMRKEGVMYFPRLVATTDTRPTGIVREPEYRAKPKYATLQVGNGPKSRFVVALDEPEGQEPRIYVDVNHNGDLTDDGDGSWAAKSENNGIASYGPNAYVLRASYGTGAKETAFGPYGIALHRTPLRNQLTAYRTSARVGQVTARGKRYAATLVENDSDGVFAKRFDRVPPDANGRVATKPVWLSLDPIEPGLPDGNPAKRHNLDIRGTFALDGLNYVAEVSADGSRIALAPTVRVVAAPPPPTAQPKILAAGTTAPDFVAEAVNGGQLKLSDYQGKVVVLDFWATWCGPCQRSMPYIEKLHNIVKAQDVVVIGLCVWDEKEALTRWLVENRPKYSFTLAYDPAGRRAGNVAQALYRVSGIPTTYIIGKDGKVAGASVGSDSEAEIEKTLKGLGVRVTL